jgi:hypothetical protein
VLTGWGVEVNRKSYNNTNNSLFVRNRIDRGEVFRSGFAIDDDEFTSRKPQSIAYGDPDSPDPVVDAKKLTLVHEASPANPVL